MQQPSFNRFRFLLPVAILFMASCAAYYKPLIRSYGYSETPLSETEVLVSYIGNPYAISVEIARIYTLYRCAEITLERGFDYFEIYSTPQDGFIETPEVWGIPTISRRIILHKGTTQRDKPRYYEARFYIEEHEFQIKRKPAKK